MKRIKLFAFCPDEHPENIVFYAVLIGRSVRDQQAAAYVKRIAQGDARFIFMPYDAQVAQWLEHFCADIYNGMPEACRPLALLRRRFVHVQRLAAFLRVAPAALLNSQRLGEKNLDRSLVLAGVMTAAQCRLRATKWARRA